MKEQTACYLFAIKTLVKYNADGPDVDFGGDFWRLFTNNKTFRRQIPAAQSYTFSMLAPSFLCEISHYKHNIQHMNYSDQ